MVTTLFYFLIVLATLVAAIWSFTKVVNETKLFVLASNQNPYYTNKEKYYKSIGMTDKTKAKRGKFMLATKRNLQFYLLVFIASIAVLFIAYKFSYLIQF